MFKKRLHKAALMLLLFPLFASSNEHAETNQVLELLVYKTPTCGCCKKWISHIPNEGIRAYSKDFQIISNIKREYGIAAKYRSCHTAVTREGVAFEGHVPAKYIKQFISEDHPDAIGLSVPAMPVGSPGMEMGDQFMPYSVLILFKDGTSKAYAEVNSFEEQFE